ncbi:hypothetical protein Srufu_078880 [Streptomyces libani subsp. rufus]|nr:hypothetical protein Srufu_000100 [Streptomyces libani subsp. rufus]BCK73935.1 hypothetical protein Srufu_078880 [Streptomyces libani subsp. rufus]
MSAWPHRSHGPSLHHGVAHRTRERSGPGALHGAVNARLSGGDRREAWPPARRTSRGRYNTDATAATCNTADRAELDSDRQAPTPQPKGCNATTVGAARGMDRPSW